MATQQRLADEEKERLATVVEIRDAGAMGDGLFVLQDLQPGELTLDQPNHHSTTSENHNTGLPHALQEAKTLTSFARPPHDLLHTFPRQPASAAPPCERHRSACAK